MNLVFLRDCSRRLKVNLNVKQRPLLHEMRTGAVTSFQYTRAATFSRDYVDWSTTNLLVNVSFLGPYWCVRTVTATKQSNMSN